MLSRDAGGVDGDPAGLDRDPGKFLVARHQPPFEGEGQFGFLRSGQFQILCLAAGGHQRVEGDGGDGPLPPHAEADFALSLEGVEAEQAAESFD